jgi:alpha-N-arabinofuranosidase
MRQALLAVDRRRTLGRIDPWIYGQFLEQIGRAVYGGVLDDAGQLRDDVVEACRQMGPTLLRWPGGNFASGYHWRDGIGPVAERPLRRDLAWAALEPNRFGTEEALDLTRRLGAASYLNLNTSTGTIDEALSWLEYCNATDDLPEVKLRRAGPHPDPHGVRVWGIGNENYGWWQHGHSSAESYGEVAREWAKLLRWADPTISLVAVGSPEPDWNWTVLRESARFVDYLSLHFYWHGDTTDPYHSILAGPAAAEASIVSAFGMAQAACRSRGVHHPVRLAIDEWGVWSRTNFPTSGVLPDLDTLMRNGLSARSGIDTRFEEPYDLKDALTHASWLHVMWRHPEKIGLATEAQMVNVLAPIHVTPDAVLRHTVFWTLAIATAHAGPTALDVLVQTDEGVPAPGTEQRSLPALDAGGTLHDDGRLHLSLVNRLLDDELEVTLDGVSGPALLIELADDDAQAGNTLERPDRITPSERRVELDGRIVLPPHSHTTIVVG